MKYLESFDVINTKFKKGDLVICNDTMQKVKSKTRIENDPLIIDFLKNNVGEIVMITGIINKKIPINVRYLHSIPYYSKKDNLWFKENELRLATSEEIEQYNLEKEAKKYNIG